MTLTLDEPEDVLSSPVNLSLPALTLGEPGDMTSPDPLTLALVDEPVLEEVCVPLLLSYEDTSLVLVDDFEEYT